MKNPQGPVDKITISNFKGLSELELNGLSNFNLLIGHNNTGKTSVLKALAFAGGLEPKDFFRNFLKKTRNIEIKEIKDYRNLFYRFQIENLILVAFDNADATTLEYQIEYKSMVKEGDDKAKIKTSVLKKQKK